MRRLRSLSHGLPAAQLLAARAFDIVDSLRLRRAEAGSPVLNLINFVRFWHFRINFACMNVVVYKSPN